MKKTYNFLSPGYKDIESIYSQEGINYRKQSKAVLAKSKARRKIYNLMNLHKDST